MLAATLARIGSSVIMGEIEGEAGGARADQRTERDAGIEDADDAADVAAAEIVHHHGRQHRDPSAIEDAEDEGENRQRPELGDTTQIANAIAMPTNITSSDD